MRFTRWRAEVRLAVNDNKEDGVSGIKPRRGESWACGTSFRYDSRGNMNLGRFIARRVSRSIGIGLVCLLALCASGCMGGPMKEPQEDAALFSHVRLVGI